MTVDTQQKVITAAVYILGGVAGLSVVMLGILAIVHDGNLAVSIVTILGGVLNLAVPAFATLAGVHSVVDGIVASKTIKANAQVQTAAIAPADGGNAS